MMEPFLIQISHWLVKPFNLTYWGCLYLKKWRNYSIFCKCIENWQFSKFQTIFKGGTLGKKLFFQFFKILLFHFGISYGPIIKQCKDIRMLKKHILTWCYTIVVVLWEQRTICYIAHGFSNNTIITSISMESLCKSIFSNSPRKQLLLYFLVHGSPTHDQVLQTCLIQMIQTSE